jgi:phospholipid N-methyltransferase
MNKLDRIEAKHEIECAIETLRNIIRHAEDRRIVDQILSGLPLVTREANRKIIEMNQAARNIPLVNNGVS